MSALELPQVDPLKAFTVLLLGGAIAGIFMYVYQQKLESGVQSFGQKLGGK